MCLTTSRRHGHFPNSPASLETLVFSHEACWARSRSAALSLSLPYPAIDREEEVDFPARSTTHQHDFSKAAKIAGAPLSHLLSSLYQHCHLSSSFVFFFNVLFALLFVIVEVRFSCVFLSCFIGFFLSTLLLFGTFIWSRSNS